LTYTEDEWRRIVTRCMKVNISLGVFEDVWRESEDLVLQMRKSAKKW
jgi:hypothetical protein